MCPLLTLGVKGLRNICTKNWKLELIMIYFLPSISIPVITFHSNRPEEQRTFYLYRPARTFLLIILICTKIKISHQTRKPHGASQPDITTRPLHSHRIQMSFETYKYSWTCFKRHLDSMWVQWPDLQRPYIRIWLDIEYIGKTGSLLRQVLWNQIPRK